MLTNRLIIYSFYLRQAFHISYEKAADLIAISRLIIIEEYKPYSRMSF